LLVSREASGKRFHSCPPKIYIRSFISPTHPFANHGHNRRRDAIISHVRSRQLRPTFPPGTPHRFAALAGRLWAPEPSDRPAFGTIVAELTRMHMEVEAALPSSQPIPHAPHARVDADSGGSGGEGPGAEGGPGDPAPSDTPSLRHMLAAAGGAIVV